MCEESPGVYLFTYYFFFARNTVQKFVETSKYVHDFCRFFAPLQINRKVIKLERPICNQIRYRFTVYNHKGLIIKICDERIKE